MGSREAAAPHGLAAAPCRSASAVSTMLSMNRSPGSASGSWGGSAADAGTSEISPSPLGLVCPQSVAQSILPWLLLSLTNVLHTSSCAIRTKKQIPKHATGSSRVRSAAQVQIVTTVQARGVPASRWLLRGIDASVRLSFLRKSQILFLVSSSVPLL